MKIAVCISNLKKDVKYSWIKHIKDYVMKDSSYNWGAKFAENLDKYNIEYDFVYIDKNDWIEKVQNYDVIIWKPAFMGTRSSYFFKEKIYFMQYVMKKRVYPNYESIWHFDSKIAQSYLFKYKKIYTPNTFVSFDYNDIIDNLRNFQYPLIIKQSNGAGSSGVRLANTFKDAVKYVNQKFIYENILARKVNSKLFDRFGESYFQEFLFNNKADLRITIIGNRYAVGFWRKNRENDFRASGSGLLDYNSEVPKNIIRYCSEISRNNNFDSMAYDILFKGKEFFIVEISYGYNESAIYNCSGYYELDDEGNATKFNQGHYWPQELWIRTIIENEKLVGLTPDKIEKK